MDEYHVQPNLKLAFNNLHGKWEMKEYWTATKYFSYQTSHMGTSIQYFIINLLILL